MIVLEEKLAALKMEYESKRNILAAAMKETEDMKSRIQLNIEKKNGLLIRCLNKKLLSHVIEYLGGKHSSVSAVCKYWNICANNIH
jgi:hypothetical protein